MKDLRSRVRWAVLAPWGLVALVVGFNLWVLRDERIPTQSGNDSEIHRNMVQWAVQRIQSGHLPLDGWFPDFGLGFPQFHQYQSLPHVVAAYVATVFGVDTTYFWSLYLLLALWPICIYLSLRLFGFSRWTGAAAAVVSPLIVTGGASGLTNFGYEWGSYVWQGHGVWAQLWGMWLLPLSLALTWRAIARGGSVTAAAVVTGLAIACHFLTGYLALVAIGVWLLVTPNRLRQRLLRGVIVIVGSLAAILWVIVPVFADSAYAIYTNYPRGSVWYDSYGAGKITELLVTGKLLDAGRFPIVTILAAIGAAVSVMRARRDEKSRAVVGFFVASLLLTFGRRTFGAIADLLPQARNLYFPRFIMGVQLGAIVFAGIGLAWLGESAVALARSRRWRLRPALVGAIATVALLAALAPAWTERAAYESNGARLMAEQRAEDKRGGKDLAELAALTVGSEGRIYAGTPSGGGTTKVQFVPLYAELINRGYDTFGDFLRVSSLSTATESLFFPSPAQLDLDGVRWVITLRAQPPPLRVHFVARRGVLRLWRLDASTGYLAVVDTVGPSIAADADNIKDRMAPVVHSRTLGDMRLPTVAFDGARAASPTVPAGTTVEPPAGAVLEQTAAPDDGKFRGVVTARRPAVVLLKSSFHPRWHVTVDGKPATPEFVAPTFVGVKVSPGEHVVAFTYEPYPHYLVLFLLSVVAIAALVTFDVYSNRRRRRQRSSVDTQAQMNATAAAAPAPEEAPVLATASPVEFADDT